MPVRRNLLLGLAGPALGGGGFAAGAFREAGRQAQTRLFAQGQVIPGAAGPLEFAVAGNGPPLMMIHGTGGGLDQGLLFAAGLRKRWFRIIAPSSFGYLGSAFPDDASPAHQADVLVGLLDHLGIDRLPVIGGSAGALTAAEFAFRHRSRCSHLVLLVPAANLTDRDPVQFAALPEVAVTIVLESDFRFWALARLAPGQMIRRLLATDPALLRRVSGGNIVPAGLEERHHVRVGKPASLAISAWVFLWERSRIRSAISRAVAVF